MSKRGCAHFCREMELVLVRAVQEYDMSYAEIIGCLDVLKYDVMLDMEAEEEE